MRRKPLLIATDKSIWELKEALGDHIDDVEIVIVRDEDFEATLEIVTRMKDDDRSRVP